MTHEEQALIRITKEVNEKDHYYINKWYQNSLLFEELADPIEESGEIEHNNTTYFCRRETYYDRLEGRVMYGYTIYKWDGTYTERPLAPKSKVLFKFKNWKEVFHSRGVKKIEPKKAVLDMLKLMGEKL